MKAQHTEFYFALKAFDPPHPQYSTDCNGGLSTKTTLIFGHTYYVICMMQNGHEVFKRKTARKVKLPKNKLSHKKLAKEVK